MCLSGGVVGFGRFVHFSLEFVCRKARESRDKGPGGFQFKMFKRIEKTVKVKNKQGLHARPAALFVQIANKYDSSIKVLKDDQVVNGKSIMGILMLAAEKDSEVTIIAEGNDSEEAVCELEGILNSDE